MAYTIEKWMNFTSTRRSKILAQPPNKVYKLLKNIHPDLRVPSPDVIENWEKIQQFYREEVLNDHPSPQWRDMLG